VDAGGPSSRRRAPAAAAGRRRSAGRAHGCRSAGRAMAMARRQLLQPKSPPVKLFHIDDDGILARLFADVGAGTMAPHLAQWAGATFSLHKTTDSPADSALKVY
jgi:hypothetical protein